MNMFKNKNWGDLVDYKVLPFLFKKFPKDVTNLILNRFYIWNDKGSGQPY